MRSVLTAPVAGAMSARQRWAALVVLAGSLLLVMMDMTILIIALPDLAADLAPTAVQQLWIVDIFSLVLAGLLIPMSAAADRFGRKLVLLLGFATFGVVSLLVVAADSAVSVIVLRALLGAGGAMIMPTTLSMIRTIFLDPKERATALAVWAVVSGLGAVIGPLVGGTLLEYFSWQAAFLVNVPIAFLAVAAGLVLLPEAKDANPPRWDVLATVLSIAGMSALVWSIKRLAEEGWGDPTAWSVLAVATALLAAFVRRCLSRPDPLLDVRLFRSKPFSAGTIAAFAAMFGMAAVLLLVAQWLQVVRGMSPLMAGIGLLPIAAGSMVFAPVAPSLAVRVGARLVLAGGLAVTGVGLVLLFAVGSPLTYPQLVAPLFLVGAGMGSLAIASAIIMGSTPSAKAGNAAAIEESMYDLGNVLGIAVLGSLAAALYRGRLAIDDLVETGLPADVAATAEDSVVGAVAVGEQLGSPTLVDAAKTAFTEALVQASLAGGLILLAGALTVYLLVPRTFDITVHDGEH